nr:unnamed protein product [Callosobruchus analis]
MAATDVHQHQLFNELNKIVKKDLIYYIINKKLPANVVSALSEEVVKFLEKGQQDDEVFHDSIATEQEVCRNVSCLNRCGDSTARCEISMDNILVRELERSNNSLNTIISLLQAQNSKVMRDQNNTPQTRSRQNNPIDSLPLSTETRGRSPTSVAKKIAVPVPPPPLSPPPQTLSSIPGRSCALEHRRAEIGSTTQQKSVGSQPSICDKPPPAITSQQLSKAVYEAQSKRIFNSHTNPDEPIQILDEGWRDVKHKRRRPKPIVGTLTPKNCSIPSAVPKMATLHVSRLAPTTTNEAMKNYLAPHFPEVIADTINSKHPERYASFKISIYENNFKAAMNPELWPQDCYVQRFFFRRKTVLSTR